MNGEITDVSAGSGPGAGPARSRGFTLLELTIVLVLAALMLGYAGLTFSGYFQRSSARRAAQVFARDLTLARSAALRSRESVVIRFYEASRWYQIETESSSTELVRRRFGVNADVSLSAIDLLLRGDSVLFTRRGTVDLSNLPSGDTLGEARFSAGSSEYSVFFNGMGASRVQER